MVRKITSIILVCLVSICCFATSTQAVDYDVYESGTLSSTYTTYFKDILSGQSILSDYVAFRSGQYTYTLVVGDLDYNGSFSSSDTVKVFEFDTQSGYNSYTKYTVAEENSFYLNTIDTVVYSNLGDYPHLIERGANIETINTILLFVIFLSFVISRFFRSR